MERSGGGKVLSPHQEAGDDSRGRRCAGLAEAPGKRISDQNQQAPPRRHGRKAPGIAVKDRALCNTKRFNTEGTGVGAQGSQRRSDTSSRKTPRLSLASKSGLYERAKRRMAHPFKKANAKGWGTLRS